MGPKKNAVNERSEPSPEIKALERKQRNIERRVRFIELRLGILRDFKVKVKNGENHAA